MFLKVFLFLYFSCTQTEMTTKLSVCPTFSEMATISYQIVEESEEQSFSQPVIVAAIVWKESKIKRLATGADRDLGLMQVQWKRGSTYATHESNKGRTPNLYDSRENIREGIARLKAWQSKPKTRRFFLAHYNCGSNLNSKLCRKSGHGLDYQRDIYGLVSRFLRKLGMQDLS